MSAANRTPGDSPLRHLGPAWFSIVMGLCGLSLAWHRAAVSLGPAAHAFGGPGRGREDLPGVDVVVPQGLHGEGAREGGARGDPLPGRQRHQEPAAVEGPLE